MFLFKACLTMPSSSWLVLNAAGLWERWGKWGRVECGGVEEEKEKKREKKVEKILLISSRQRFPSLKMATAPL